MSPSANHITPESIKAISGSESLVEFLRDKLLWPIPEALTIDDLKYEWKATDLGLTSEDVKGSTISQLKPFVDGQPWGIFILKLATPRLYVSALRKIIRGLNPSSRRLKTHPTWAPKHLLFICTSDWKDYSIAHFDGADPATAKISSFGWQLGSDFIRTLCEFNIPQLRYPSTEDMFGIDSEAWVVQWSTAFDVKPVTDRFYEEYDRVFRSIKTALAKQFGLPSTLWTRPQDKWTTKEHEHDERLHLFVQNFVNRLMFLKFLEKRRWLDFNPAYLSDLFATATQRGENFYEEYLRFVFFAGLNHQIDRPKKTKQAPLEAGRYSPGEIGTLPFLNGGLFEKNVHDEEVKIPNEVFAELFGLFNRYNFTISEDTPLDVEVAVNPEMLGKVFEESVISRKEKGAYYTPRHIVSFMCRESLKLALEQRCAMPDVTAKIQRLVDSHSAGLLTGSEALDLYKALAAVKVVDPAVGSGAFPVGMMFEILECYKAIGAKLEHDHPFLVQNKLAKPSEVYQLKKQIIQNNLYGVDIEEFAVNIARLRFWLSLAVDFPVDFADRADFIANVGRIEPLPNLLYKIRRGNSLYAEYHGVSLEPHGRTSSGQLTAGRKQRIQQGITVVSDQIGQYFALTDSVRKHAIENSIDTGKKRLALKEIDIQIKALRDSVPQEDMFGLSKKQKADLKETQEEIERLEGVRKDLARSDGLAADFPMIWDIDFGEVLSKGGFDIVIANPPYVRQEDIKKDKEELVLQYECYTGTADLYTYFYEKGVKLLREGGVLTFISSNKFFRAGYGAKLRQYLAERTQLRTIIDFGDLPVFEAVTYPCVIVATKNLATESIITLSLPAPVSSAGSKGDKSEQPQVRANATLRARTVANEEELPRFEDAFRKEAINMKQTDLHVGGWRIEDLQVRNLLEKIKKAGIPLGEYVGGKIYRGITTGYNQAFVIDDPTRRKLVKEDKKSAEVIKPFLRGRDIKRYAIEDPGLWLIFTRRGIDIKRYPAIENHLRQFKSKLTPGGPDGRKPGAYKWYEIQDSIDYWEEFEKAKIMLAEIAVRSTFTYDTDGHFGDTTTYIIPTPSKALLAVLNSQLVTYYFGKISSQVQAGYLRWKAIYLTQISIAIGTAQQQKRLLDLVDAALLARNANVDSDILALEHKINGIVYEMYGLTEEEVRVVEGNTR